MLPQQNGKVGGKHLIEIESHGNVKLPKQGLHFRMFDTLACKNHRGRDIFAG